MTQEAAGLVEELRAPTPRKIVGHGEYDDWDAINSQRARAADFIASITSVDGVKLETTAGERIEWWVSAHHARCSCKQCRLIRDHDTLTAALATKHYLLRLCEEQHDRDEAANALKDERILALETALREIVARIGPTTPAPELSSPYLQEAWRRYEGISTIARTALEAK